MIYFTLFLVALIAATLFPASSEVVLSAMIVEGRGEVLWLWSAATAGNVLGSCINYYLGRYLLRWQYHRFFPVKPKQLERATRAFNQFGKWSLMFAWLPVIGDALTLVAGVLRTRFDWFVLLVTIGKGMRYALVVYAALAVIT
ncbi:YqaA family protein [Pseudoalteromonas sp. T1lg65]|uniref:YqaA family protein n=1 Tax=Pseudoalteromonas sp. T1lg65 TaxID=2077101 RepID=UPI003F792353